MVCPPNQKKLHRDAKKNAGGLTLPPDCNTIRCLNFKREGHQCRTRILYSRRCKSKRRFLFQPRKSGLNSAPRHEEHCTGPRHFRDKRATSLRKLMEEKTFYESCPEQPIF